MLSLSLRDAVRYQADGPFSFSPDGRRRYTVAASGDGGRTCYSVWLGYLWPAESLREWRESR